MIVSKPITSGTIWRGINSMGKLASSSGSRFRTRGGAVAVHEARGDALTGESTQCHWCRMGRSAEAAGPGYGESDNGHHGDWRHPWLIRLLAARIRGFCVIAQFVLGG
jgi:hypothetical protein